MFKKPKILASPGDVVHSVTRIDVDIPFEAYDCQIIYIEKVIQMLEEVRSVSSEPFSFVYFDLLTLSLRFTRKWPNLNISIQFLILLVVILILASFFLFIRSFYL